VISDIGQFTAVIVNGEDISLAEVLRLAKWREQVGFLLAAADSLLIRREALQRGIEVTGEELQKVADAFRIARKLFETEDLIEWLADAHLSLAEWEELLEDEIRLDKVRAAVTAPQIEQHFAENRLSFDAAALSQIVVRDEEVAKELRAQVRDEGADFHKLARTYSIDEATRPAGGYRGILKRDAIAEEARAAVFGAQPLDSIRGRVVGPFKTDAGWVLIRVHAIHPAALDEATREQIKSTLFGEWLALQRTRAQICMPLLTMNSEDEDPSYSTLSNPRPQSGRGLDKVESTS
jgi:parvulin-like peptidyl-prolyl isomerase